MFDLKPLTQEGVAAALKKAERYRLLNEPWEAESICWDILEVDPENQPAVTLLLLAVTDQFDTDLGGKVPAALALLPRFRGEYDRLYYAGIIAERRGKALFRRSAPGTGPVVYDWLREAMNWYERAERVRPAGEDDPILRWNTCARIIMAHEHVRAAPVERRASMELE